MTVRKHALTMASAMQPGYLFRRAKTECLVETRRRVGTISFDEITAVKVMPPPPRRVPRYTPIGPVA